jgi:hypothetical protein
MPGAFAFDARMHKLAKRPRMLTSEMGAELGSQDDESIADTLHWVPERFMS